MNFFLRFSGERSKARGEREARVTRDGRCHCFSENVSMQIQLIRQRLSKKSIKAYATKPKGSLGNTR